MNLHRVLDVCKTLALDAGRAILEVYRTDFAVEHKSDCSPVTEADLRANRIITDGLVERFPEAAILSEEAADNPDRLQNPWCFIVDPLDGTKQFVGRNGAFTVNIGLAREGKVVAGVVLAPVTGDLYLAAEGMGAFRERDGRREAIRVTDKLDSLTLMTSGSHRTDMEARLIESHKDRIARVEACGSSIKGCLVAAGDADIYYRYGPTSEWDTAAMQCVVEQAGGIFRQGDGSPMTYNRRNIRNEKGFFAVNRPENIWIL